MYHGSAATTRRRVAVHAESRSVDLVLSDAVPVGSLIPSIVDALPDSGEIDTGLTAVAFQLSLPGGHVLDASKTLNELGIRDGSTLVLVHSATAFVAPPCDDAAEAVSAAVAEIGRPWTNHATQLVGAMVAVCLAGVAAAVLIRACDADTEHGGYVGVALTTGLFSVLAAALAYRVFNEPRAGLTLGLMGTGFAALAGFFAIPGDPGVPNTLFAAAATATSAAIVRVFSCHAIVFTALACLAATCAAMTAVGAAVGATLPVIGAGLAATSLALIEAAAPVSIVIGRLTPVRIDGPDRLHAGAIRAHIWLNSLLAAFSAAAALGAISATAERSFRGIVFATMVGGALVLRARAHQDVDRSVPPIICGAATLCAVLVSAAVVYPDHALHITALSMTLSILALYLGFMSGSATGFPTGRRSVELMQYFALATIAPLAFWLCGLYGAARSLNLP